jgi:hypothetical protein
MSLAIAGDYSSVMAKGQKATTDAVLKSLSTQVEHVVFAIAEHTHRQTHKRSTTRQTPVMCMYVQGRYRQ